MKTIKTRSNQRNTYTYTDAIGKKYPDRLLYQCRITAKAKAQDTIERANRKKIKALMKDME